MILYEVNIEIAEEKEEQFLTWIQSHVAAVLSTNLFQHAVFYQEINPDDFTKTNSNYVVQYLMTSEEDFHEYVEKHAPRLRKESTETFGDQIQLTRRILKSQPKNSAKGKPE